MPEELRNNTVGSPFTEILIVDSTNNYAMQLAHKHLATHGQVIFAYDQQKGKGQRGKQWQSIPRQNIILSVILSTNGLQVSNQFNLNMAIALSCYDLFSKYALDKTTIKWPNDIYWNDRKAGGILIENIIHGREWQWAICGMGININQTEFDSFLNNAVSLKQITGKDNDVIKLAKELCNNIDTRFRQLVNEQKNFLEEYNTVLYKRGEKVKLKKQSIVFDCNIKEVNASGQLIVENGIEQVFNSGEVEWII